MDNAARCRFLKRRKNCGRLSDVAGDEAYSIEIALFHNRVETTRIGAAIEDHNRISALGQRFHDPGADATLRSSYEISLSHVLGRGVLFEFKLRSLVCQ